MQRKKSKLQYVVRKQISLSLLSSNFIYTISRKLHKIAWIGNLLKRGGCSFIFENSRELTLYPQNSVISRDTLYYRSSLIYIGRHCFNVCGNSFLASKFLKTISSA